MVVNGFLVIGGQLHTVESVTRAKIDEIIFRFSVVLAAILDSALRVLLEIIMIEGVPSNN